MKAHCYSVRLSSLTRISDKCICATAFDGSEALIPNSQIFGQDYSVSKSEAYWISAWILEKKGLQYSSKKEAWFDSITRKEIPNYIITKKTPAKVEFTEAPPIKELER
jgi:hypothetical protein